ncbi:MAG: hypothetical protein IVW53_06270 [Chloroflexi bacterium]|nr:hypothetical protein [Chloroflexota bacterium]
MRHPPFDSEAGREPLLAMLNELPGVDIPAERLRGRPRIPLSVLADPDALARLIGVLDRIVDETQPSAMVGAIGADDASPLAGDDE